MVAWINQLSYFSFEKELKTLLQLNKSGGQSDE